MKTSIKNQYVILQQNRSDGIKGTPVKSNDLSIIKADT